MIGSVIGRLWPRARSLDRNLVLAIALGVIAASTFLARPGLPRETDAELHVYRAAELGHVLRAGAFYPRWAPDLYFGYGYPIFNYYAPLTYYVANLFDLVPGVGIVGGTKAVFVLGLVLASTGACLLGRELFGPVAGVVVAASFVFAPYVVLIDPHARGDLAEHFAICLLPMAFYAFRRLMSGVGGRGALLGSAVTLAIIVFSHNLIGLVAGAMLLAYWVWEISVGGRRKRAFWGMMTFVLAAAPIAFFWIPFLAERNAIRLDVIGSGHFDFREHFLTLWRLLAPSRVLDLGAAAPRYQFNLGFAQWLLALPAVVGVLRAKTIDRRGASYFVVMGVVLILLMLPVSVAIWEHVPGMPYLQFPWRLLGPANLMLAVCAGCGVTLVRNERWRGRVGGGLLLLTMLLALPTLYPPMWAPDFGGTTPKDILEWERTSLALGTTSTGDFLPVKAALVPMYPEPTLIESYDGPGPIDRVNRATLPEGAKVDIIESGPLDYRLAVSTPQEFVLRLYTFYFPGWRVAIDGVDTEIDVAGPEGFITVWVPVGAHDVVVRFGDTPARTAGWIISLLGLVGLVSASAVISPLDKAVPRSSDLRACAWLGSALVLFVMLKGTIVDPRDDWMRHTSPPGQAWPALDQQRVDFGGLIELLGYDLPRTHVRSGDEFPVVLYWHALTPLGVNYQAFVHVARPRHILWGQEDHLNPGALPTTRWPADKYVWDEYSVKVLPGTPPGTYELNVGLYSLADGYRLTRHDEQGQATGDSYVVGSIQVDPPRRPPQVADLKMTGVVMETFPASGVTLLGYSLSEAQASLPGAWPVTLYWRADQDQPAASTRDLVFLDGDGREAWRLGGEPMDGGYPFKVWRAGEIVRDPLVFVASEPVALDPGVYHFGVIVGSDEDLVLLDTVEFAGQDQED